MDPTISISKGCFVFKNGATRANKVTKKKSTKRKLNDTQTSVLGSEVTGQPFYATYTKIWRELQEDIENLQQESYTKTLEDLVDYIVGESNVGGNVETYGMEEILPAAALLTGINQTDHLERFETLSQRIHEKISANVCILQSRDCATIKAAVETMVYNFIESQGQDDNEDRDHKRLRRTQCTMKQLHSWYKNNFLTDEQNDIADVAADDVESTTNAGQHPLVVVLPDFECFSSNVLQDLILILSTHCAELPFVLVLGVATAITAVHNTLPYHVTSKIKLRVFQTQSAPMGLHEILDHVILAPKYAFRLSGKALKFLTHIFLYYDFSINGFVQGFKYCLMEHYFQGNAYALCCNYSDSLKKINAMTHDDIEAIRHLLSFRPYVESINDCRRIISILTDDDYLKKKLPQLLRNCHVHFLLFRVFLEFLIELVADLPKNLLGRYRHELYTLCLSKELTEQPEFKECCQMLSFMSRSEFVEKIEKSIRASERCLQVEFNGIVQELAVSCGHIVAEKFEALKAMLRKFNDDSSPTPDEATQRSKANDDGEVSPLKQLTSRHDLKERLLKMSKQEKPQSHFARCVQDVLHFVEEEICKTHLCPLQRGTPPLHELFVFTDITSVRRNIIGAPRAALHMALNNPHFYLQCKCCHLQESSQLVATLPDLAVAYKLHLECGRMINIFDWLQAFRSVVDYTEDDQEQVDPQIQARFTRAVAELQFLGYIKMSKRKTDHATRLTW